MEIRRIKTQVIESVWEWHSEESGTLININTESDIQLGFNIRKIPDGTILFNCAFDLKIKDTNSDCIEFHLFVLNTIDNYSLRPKVEDLMEVFRKSTIVFKESLFKEAAKHNVQNLNIGGIAFDDHTARKEIIMVLNNAY